MSTQLENSIDEQVTLAYELVLVQMKRNPSYVPPLPPWATTKAPHNARVRRHMYRNAKDAIIYAVHSLRNKCKYNFSNMTFCVEEIHDFLKNCKEQFTYSKSTISMEVGRLKKNSSYCDLEGRQVEVCFDDTGYRNFVMVK